MSENRIEDNDRGMGRVEKKVEQRMEAGLMARAPQILLDRELGKPFWLDTGQVSGHKANGVVKVVYLGDTQVPNTRGNWCVVHRGKVFAVHINNDMVGLDKIHEFLIIRKMPMGLNSKALAFILP